MKIEVIQALIVDNKPDKLISVLETFSLAKEAKEAIEQYLPEKHKVASTTHRPDKPLDDGTEVKVNRILLPIQKRIVRMAVSFLGSPEMKGNPSETLQQDLFNALQKTLDDNKIKYRFKSLARHCKSERQAAILIYTEKAPEDYWEGTNVKSNFRFRTKLLAPSLGDELYPVFGDNGDMIAMGRKFETEEFNNEGKKEKILHFDLYTNERYYFFSKTGSDWTVNYDTSIETLNYTGDGEIGQPNILKKIPFIYVSQPITDWHDVQSIIERLEEKISNHADTNDHFDSPIFFGEGEIEGFAEKGERGKLLIGKNGAKASYLTWDSAPESMRMEIGNLVKFIDLFTSTPEITPEALKGLGQFSGIAIKFLFMDAHMKAADSEDIFGEAMQRLYNYFKSGIAVLDPKFKNVSQQLKVYPEFNYFLPKDYLEELDGIAKGIDAGILSKETGVELNPLIENIELEKDRILKQEQNKKAEPVEV